MKSNILKLREKLFRKRKNDIFGHTRYRLTILYSGLLMLFLLLFVIIVYSLFYYIISNEQKQEVLELANQEWISHQSEFKHLLSLKNQNEINKKLKLTSKEFFFYYLLNNSHHVVSEEENAPNLRPKILTELKGWYPNVNEVHYETLTLSNGQQVYLQTTGKRVYDKGQLVGVFYIGTNISFYFHMFEWLFFLLVGLSVIFLLAASIVGQFMAKRAMIPIVEAYTHQQEFAADASHELRTPLSVIKSSIEVIELEEKNVMSDFAYKVLLDMKNEVNSMAKLVGNLLTLARSDSGIQQLSYENFNITSVFDQIIRQIQTLANSQKINISLAAPNSLFVYGDKERLKQLVYILLDNAIKYSPNGGDIRVTLADCNINQKNYLCIKVKDTGIGILPAQLERIFDRFYRVDKNRSREIGGSGLGLTIAKWIVEAHQGKIEVSSIPEKGTVFTIWIPNIK